MTEKAKEKELLRILCLEDEPRDAELIRELLEEAGYELKMDVLDSKKKFVSAVKSNKYDVILADYKLPSFNASAALRLVKDLCPDIPFVCVSGTMGEDVAVDLLKQGATDYVLKDRLGRLPSAIRRALHEAHALKIGRQAEESLQESERKFRSLVENAFDAIYLMRGRRYEYVNPRFAELTGYTFEELTSEDFDFDRLLTDVSRQIVNERYQKRVQGIEVPSQYETQIKTKDDRVLNVEISTVTLGSKDNVIVLGMIHDPSRRIEAEETLRTLTTRYEAILSAIPDIIMEVDNNKVYTWTNQAGIEFFGDDVIGKEAKYYFEDETDIYGYIRPLFNGEKNTLYIENWQRRRDGEKRLLAWWCRVLKDNKGEVVGVLSSARDITEIKKSQETIQHLNRVLHSIREVNLLIVNENNPQEIINKTCAILVKRRGYREAMIILTDESGRPYIWADTGSKDAFLPIENNLKQGILPPCCDEKLFQEEVNIISDRSKVCASCPVAADFIHYKAINTRIHHDKKLYGYLSVSVDTELTIDEEEKSLFKELASDVAFALRNIEQAKAKQQVEEDRDRIEAEYRQAQKMEAVGLLAGGIAHDFNNMLTIIIGYTDLALAKLSVDDALYRNFVEIQAASQRSMNIIRQLLAFSRKQLIAPEAARLNELIADLIRMLSRLIGEDIELKFLPAEDLWNIWIDPSQIHQILTNLAVNARDAIADVGSVNIETANVVLDKTYNKIHKYIIPGEYVSLIFSDTGKGISPDILDRIFEPFFTTKEAGKGTGLGLPTVYGIVKQNNGYIHVYSEPRMGTTFKIYFPRYHGDVEVPPEKPSTGVITGTEIVLIVEDYEEILYLAVEILEEYGYTVLKARNPNEAIITSGQYKGDIHLLITDVVMPTMNGKDLEEKIKIDRPKIRTLFMSGYTADIIAQRGVIEQGVAFLQKPFTIQSLVAKVRDVLDS